MTVRRALWAVPLLLALAGCGIRPTAVPVDAGAPASRTACPTPVRVPSAAAALSPTPTAGPSPTAAPSKSPTALFSATATSAPCP